MAVTSVASATCIYMYILYSGNYKFSAAQPALLQDAASHWHSSICAPYCRCNQLHKPHFVERWIACNIPAALAIASFHLVILLFILKYFKVYPPPPPPPPISCSYIFILFHDCRRYPRRLTPCNFPPCPLIDFIR